ncbi:spore coat protein [Neobacillus piezotolerans]|uniref:Spore coat protein n=1 Tax=Neobacillus piezotolerans TaxID=2259171 RepID=A0A3D8GLM2_9BACI|nr:spore coat protein [Neobacillus piezotolerans]RDU35364.1 spore coat protein [Neobacillus piezotolerans]
MEGKKRKRSSTSSPLDSYHSFLKSLVGQEVQVYKGGPESKKGKLMDVQSDYICLLAQENEQNKEKNKEKEQNKDKDKNQHKPRIVYYRTEHLQSIGENTKSNSMPRFHEEEPEICEFQSAGSFNELMQHFIRKHAQMNLGGPESKSGMVLAVSGSYIALLTEDDGVVYYNIHHIKSISESTQKQNEENDEQEVLIPDFIEADDFHDLFGKMSHKWVSINRGGPQAIEGVLVQGVGGHYTIVNNDEVLRINPFHIKNISCGPKGSFKKTKQSHQKSSKEENEENEEFESSDETRSFQSKQRNHKSSDRKTSRKTSGRTSSSSSSSCMDFRHEKVIKTIDYIWKPR